MKSKFEQLKNLCNQLEDCEFRDEILELVDEVEEEKNELEKEKDLLQDELDEQPPFESINLGLDIINFHFDKGNLLIRQQFDTLMQMLNKIPNAVV